ncbi:MAG: FRG domain-containing protein [Melioribacteraceae bacterium]|nr:FRG domain-containing protein [Melioribacteraceae bacterium]
MWDIKTDYKNLSKVETSLYGEVWAPNDFGQYSRFVSYLAEVIGQNAIWRGQSIINWPFHSSAVRRILKFGWSEKGGIDSPHAKFDYETNNLRKVVTEYEQQLLIEARRMGYDYQNGRRLYDLELLAILQHYGAATRLIDFTKNAFIALWFACQSDKNETGVVFTGRLDSKKGRTKRLINYNDIMIPIDKLLRNNQDTMFIWEPMHIFQRMKMQQGIFLVSEPIADTWGSLPIKSVGIPDPKVWNFDCSLIPIAITPKLKEDMNSMESNYWSGLFGYSVATLFPEIDGFCKYHSSEQDYDLNFPFPEKVKWEFL